MRASWRAANFISLAERRGRVTAPATRGGAMSAVENFRATLCANGLDYAGEIIADGRLHKFQAAGDHRKNSWYVIHAGPPIAGAFGCWKRGFKESWCEKRRENFTDAEWRTIRENWKLAEVERERVETERHTKARKVAAWILERARPVTIQGYLTAKGVQPHGELREYRGALVLPLRGTNGELHSLQFIGADGTKRFLTGGRIAGCFFTLADKPDGALVIAEGFATAASIAEATGLATVAAMNAGNLPAVAKALREKFPQREIIIAADNDAWTEGNPGATKATETAKTIRAKLAVPQFTDTSTKPTDFNDLHQLEGLDAVKTQIEKATTPKETDEETLQRLAALTPIEFDRCAEKEAKAMGVNVGTLRSEVEKRRPKSGAKLQGGALNMANIEPWPEAVDGAALLDEIQATNNRFMVLPPLADVLLAIWNLHTYVFDCFSYTPYLHVTSPEKECGKSTLGELMNHLCANATTPGGMSAAAMFRRIESRKPTLLLDEWDTLSDENRQAALNVLNTGFKWNGVYTICVGDDHEDRDFHTFCPKAIFGLSEAKLPDTTRSRCFSLTLQKKLPHETVEKLTRKFDGMTLRRKCLRWANDNRDKLKNTEPAMPPGLSARQEDIAEPLLAIADLCGGHWPGTMREAVAQFFGDARSEEGDIKRELLKDIQAGFKQQDPADRWSSAAIRVYLNSLEHRPWADWNEGKGISQRQISDRLRRYRITSHNIKMPDNKVAKGYYLTDFEDAFARYLPTNPDAIRYPATKPENIDDNSLFQSATKDAGSGCENVETPNKFNDGSGVADETPITAEAMLL
jgi:putative DNA primase/helicase